MFAQSKADKIRSYFAAYKAKDRKVLEDGLADDFTFTSPYDDAIDKATYFARCWPNSEKIRSHTIEKIFEQGDEAFVLYKCITNDGKNSAIRSFSRSAETRSSESTSISARPTATAPSSVSHET
jgi:ketosteroid isomerase-like protein